MVYSLVLTYIIPFMIIPTLFILYFIPASLAVYGIIVSAMSVSKLANNITPSITLAVLNILMGSAPGIVLGIFIIILNGEPKENQLPTE